MSETTDIDDLYEQMLAEFPEVRLKIELQKINHNRYHREYNAKKREQKFLDKIRAAMTFIFG
jgi:adenosine/AMP kinase